jgi:glycosyltransferase involved in cell wall biosynthesis
VFSIFEPLIERRFLKTISVIVPIKNDLGGARLLLDCLRRQTVPCEIVFVDNGSTDGTVEFLDSQGVRVLRYPGLRVGALRNRGVEVTHGDYLAFVDSDHEVDPNWLKQGIRVLDSDQEIVACGSHYLAPEQGTWVQRIWAIHRLRGAECKNVDWLASGNLFVRRDAFLGVGGFSETLVAAEDVDLCHRLRDTGGRIRHDPAIASVHHGEARTIGRFIRKEWWRGSSGIRAWISQGFPLREVPSLIWPIWHLLFSILFVVCLAIVFWKLPFGFAVATLLFTFLLWACPSILLAILVARRFDILKIAQLACLYFLYGTVRGWALFRN